jgi:hypothetical protein
MLASLLYPYDEDSRALIDVWIKELAAEKCIAVYAAGGDTYIQVLNWEKHQKIDRPSGSKIPPMKSSSRKLAKPREGSCEDRERNGPKEGNGDDADHRDNIPSLEHVNSYFLESGVHHSWLPGESQKFYDYFSALGWKNPKGNPISNWHLQVGTWIRNGYSGNLKEPKPGSVANDGYSTPEEIARASMASVRG